MTANKESEELKKLWKAQQLSVKDSPACIICSKKDILCKEESDIDMCEWADDYNHLYFTGYEKACFHHGG